MPRERMRHVSCPGAVFALLLASCAEPPATGYQGYAEADVRRVVRLLKITGGGVSKAARLRRRSCRRVPAAERRQRQAGGDCLPGRRIGQRLQRTGSVQEAVLAVNVQMHEIGMMQEYPQGIGSRV